MQTLDSPSSSMSSPDMEKETSRRLEQLIFSAINEGNKEKLSGLFNTFNSHSTAIIQLLLTTAYPNDDGFYHFDQEVALDAEELLGTRFDDFPTYSVKGLNALHISCILGDEDVAMELLEFVNNFTIEIDAKKVLYEFMGRTWGNGNTVLHLAAFMGMSDLVKRLLELGAAANRVNERRYKPVDCADDDEMRNIFTIITECKFLSKTIVAPPNRSPTLEVGSKISKSIDELSNRRVTQPESSPVSISMMALSEPAETKNRKFNSADNSPSSIKKRHSMSAGAHSAPVTPLPAKTSNPEIQAAPQPLIQEGVSQPKKKVPKFLRKVTFDPATQIFDICTNGDPVDSKMLPSLRTALGISLDFPTTPLNTPLVCKTDVNEIYTGSQWLSPLHLACTNGHYSIAQLLLSVAGSRINLRDKEGWTALHCACVEGHVEIVELLCKCQGWVDCGWNKDGVYYPPDGPIELLAKNKDGEWAGDVAFEEKKGIIRGILEMTKKKWPPPTPDLSEEEVEESAEEEDESEEEDADSQDDEDDDAEEIESKPSKEKSAPSLKSSKNEAKADAKVKMVSNSEPANHASNVDKVVPKAEPNKQIKAATNSEVKEQEQSSEAKQIEKTSIPDRKQVETIKSEPKQADQIMKSGSSENSNKCDTQPILLKSESKIEPAIQSASKQAPADVKLEQKQVHVLPGEVQKDKFKDTLVTAQPSEAILSPLAKSESKKGENRNNELNPQEKILRKVGISEEVPKAEPFNQPGKLGSFKQLFEKSQTPNVPAQTSIPTSKPGKIVSSLFEKFSQSATVGQSKSEQPLKSNSSINKIQDPETKSSNSITKSGNALKANSETSLQTNSNIEIHEAKSGDLETSPAQKSPFNKTIIIPSQIHKSNESTESPSVSPGFNRESLGRYKIKNVEEGESPAGNSFSAPVSNSHQVLSENVVLGESFPPPLKKAATLDSTGGLSPKTGRREPKKLTELQKINRKSVSSESLEGNEKERRNYARAFNPEGSHVTATTRRTDRLKAKSEAVSGDFSWMKGTFDSEINQERSNSFSSGRTNRSSLKKKGSTTGASLENLNMPPQKRTLVVPGTPRIIYMGQPGIISANIEDVIRPPIDVTIPEPAYTVLPESTLHQHSEEKEPIPLHRNGRHGSLPEAATDYNKTARRPSRQISDAIKEKVQKMESVSASTNSKSGSKAK